VEEAAFLMAVQGVIGRIEVEDDRFGRRPVRLEEEVDEQAFDGRRGMADLVVTARKRRRVLEPVQGALPGERRAVLALGLELVGQRRQDRIMPQLVMVDQILVAERDADDPLHHHRFDAVLDLGLDPIILEAGGNPPDQPDRPIGRPSNRAPASEVTSPPSKAATT
jgi:hypothetical protein